MEKMRFDLEELHAVQLRLLQRLKEMCEKHDLRYFLAFGSLLGAARDHRIIPWDDAIDVVMPWPDYNKLTQLTQVEWGDDLFLQTYETDRQYPRCFAKLRNSNTTLIRAEYTAYDINHGIYINIMPLIRLADDPDQRRRQIHSAKLYKALTEKKQSVDDNKLRQLYASVILSAASDQQRLKLREEYKEKMLAFEDQETQCCFALAGDVSLELALPCAWFASALDCEFEGMQVSIPCGWHEWLTLRYGDYQVSPISELQANKTANFITLNTRQPYIKYKGKTYCVQ